MSRPYITLNAERLEDSTLIIRVELFGYTLRSFIPEEEERAFEFCYGFAHAARLAGIEEPLAAWNLDFAALRENPEFIGQAADLATQEAREPSYAQRHTREA